MIKVLYVYDPGNHMMTSFKITTEQIIIYKTIRGQYTRRIQFHFHTMATFQTKCKPGVAGPGPSPWITWPKFGMYDALEITW